MLSPKTEGYDRGKKLAKYMTLASVSEIVLVAQDDIRVDKYTRQPDGIWRFEVHSGPEAVLSFGSVQCDVRLGDFYEGVELLPLVEPGPLRFREDEPDL